MSAGLCHGNSWVSGSPSATALGSAPRPSETILLGDSIRLTAGTNYYRAIVKPGWGRTVWTSACNAYDRGYPNCRLAERHNNGANIGFLDGHSKWLTIEQTQPLADTGSLWGHANAGNEPALN